MRFLTAALLAVCLAPCAVLAEEEGVPLGITYGVFRPLSSSTRSNFGKSWNRVGIGRVDTRVPSEWKPTFGIISLNADGPGSATLFGLNWGLIRALSPGASSVRPYAGVRAGPVYADVSSSALGVDTTTVAMNGGLSLGLVLGTAVFVEARYDAFTKVGGVDFSGLSWEAGVRLFNVRF